MSNKVLVISTSLRKGGNSETLADEYIRGAKEGGSEVKKISFVGKNIAFCQGWIACFPKAHLAGSVFAGGVDAVGTIAGHTALKNAYEMGKGVNQ